jgi:hypothetical protein
MHGDRSPLLGWVGFAVQVTKSSASFGDGVVGVGSKKAPAQEAPLAGRWPMAIRVKRKMAAWAGDLGTGTYTIPMARRDL